MTQLEQRFLTLVPQYLKEIADSLEILVNKNKEDYENVNKLNNRLKEILNDEHSRNP